MTWQTIVKSLASRLVYREGLNFIESMADERVPAFALAYLEEEQRKSCQLRQLHTSHTSRQPRLLRPSRHSHLYECVASRLSLPGVHALAEAVGTSGHEFAQEVQSLLLKGGVRVAAEKAANALNKE